MRELLSRLSVPSVPDSPAAYFSRLPRVETPRLVLRRITMGDAQDLFAYSQDPEVARHVLWRAHKSIWDTRGYIRWIQQQYRSGEPSSWCIVEKATGSVIGTIGFMAYQPDNAAVEVGYSLARRCWNRGYMTEALSAVLRQAFVALRMHRVEAQHFTANPSSGRVMEKCGMTHEGRLRERVCNKGRFMDVEMWAILREDWEKQFADP